MRSGIRWLAGALAAIGAGAGCTCAPEVAQTEHPAAIRLADAMGLGELPRAPELDPIEGDPLPYDGYTVRPVSLQVYEGFRLSGALWLPDGPGPHPAVLVAHGHFGEGKSSGESQAPAHAFAQRGWAALALDTPGVEEGDLPGRRIHFEAGAHGRALLAAAGTSAMAVQIEGLQAGLDWLAARGDIGDVAVTGASGGSVQALYLLMVDPRPVAAVLASFVPMPREARAGGCPCDLLPGWAGPDPALYAGVVAPTLWLSELEQPRPEGLPSGADFQVIAGPHGYEPAMVERAAEWLADHLEPSRAPTSGPTHTPSTSLASADVGPARFVDLVADRAPEAQVMAPRVGAVWWTDCEGDGPAVLLVGADGEDHLALAAALPDRQRCALQIEIDEIGLTEGLVTERPYLELLAGAIQGAAARHDAPVYAAGAWGLAAQVAGAPYVVRDPLGGLADVDEAAHPAWIHTPGWWTAPLYPGALASGSDPSVLAGVLAGGG